MKIHLTVAHGSGESNTKCQTQTKVDRPSLKAKAHDIMWTLWKNAWQRYLREMGMEGHAAVTQLWECLSSETAGCLCNPSFELEINIDVMIEENRKSMIGNLKILSQKVKLSWMEQHDGETVRMWAARLSGKTNWCGPEAVCS